MFDDRGHNSAGPINESI
jgi:hypothetical protein